MLPNFIVAGFPKCGTTSLYYYLMEHPEIFVPEQKELHFFTSEILSRDTAGKDDDALKDFFVTSQEAYESLYKTAAEDKLRGDFSPSYGNYPSIIPSIKDTLGSDTKIIFMLRDPVKRAYSNYLHLVREGRETLPFYEGLLAEDKRRTEGYSDFWYYRWNSEYADKIMAYQEVFPDLKVIVFEEFIKDPKEGVKEIYRFLGVDENFTPKNVGTTFNVGGVFEKNVFTNFIFGQSPLKNRLKKTFPIPTFLKKWKLAIITKYKKPTPEMDQASEAFLISKLKEDVTALNKQFALNISNWNKAFGQ